MRPASAGLAFTRRRGLGLLVCLALGYLWFIGQDTSYIAGGSDSSGYLNIAQNLRAGDLTRHAPIIPGLEDQAWNREFQQPLGFLVDSKTGRMITTYSVGLPLHLLGTAPFVTLDYAAIPVNVLLAAAAAALMFALGRQCGLPSRWALAGAALLLACPLFVLYLLQTMSDACATVWALVAIVAALQSRRHAGWALAAGFAVAVGVLVRPSSLLLLAPVAVALDLRLRSWLLLALGGLPGALFLCWYNLQLYGRALTTGYGDVSSLFSPHHVPHNALHFALWLNLLLTPLGVLPALGLPMMSKTHGRIAAVLALWITTITGFYLFYFHSGETWWYLRFILPVFPAILCGSLLVTHRAFALRPALCRHRWLPLTLLAVAVVWEIWLGRSLHITVPGDIPYLETTRWMQAHAPADSVVLQMQTSGCFTYYTHFALVRWDLIDADGWRRLQEAARAHHFPLYASLFPFEEQRAFAACPSPDWEKLTTIRGIAIWRLKPSAAGLDGG